MLGQSKAYAEAQSDGAINHHLSLSTGEDGHLLINRADRDIWVAEGAGLGLFESRDRLCGDPCAVAEGS